jgi:LuxR family quorum-sensing system transcriptional regulator CciR
MLDRLENFVKDIAALESEADLAQGLCAITREMGFSYFALTQHVDVRQAPGAGIRIDNYPPLWVDYFDEQRLGPSDPVHRATHVRTAGFAWSQLPQIILLTTRDRQILDDAARNGIGDGYTVPTHVPGESYGSFSLATRTGETLPREHVALAQLLGPFAFEAARRLRRERHGAAPLFQRLTDRQRDCLLWVARGKSDWEVGRILGVSRETVTMHLKHARERYDVPKRTQLAIHALFDGTISFVDIMRR